MIAVVDFKSNNRNAVQKSKELVETELPFAAEALYKGFVISWIDKADTKLLDSIGYG